jgi:hypothetical protein
MLAVLSKSIAIIHGDTAEKSIADSDNDTSKVSPILSLSIAITDINNPAYTQWATRMLIVGLCMQLTAAQCISHTIVEMYYPTSMCLVVCCLLLHLSTETGLILG